jgi:hypothetical protein
VELFFNKNLPIFLQILFLLILLSVNLLILFYFNKKYKYFTLKSLFLLYNIIYLVPYIFSHTNGQYGFGVAKGLSYYDFSYIHFIIVSYQTLILPIFLLVISSLKLPILNLIPRHENSIYKSLFLILIIYLFSYIYFVKPAIVHLVTFDIENILKSRVTAVLGDTSSVTGVSRFFDYKKIAYILIQPFLIYNIFNNSKTLIKLLFIFLSIFVSCIDLSKGTIAANIINIYIVKTFYEQSVKYRLLFIYFVFSFILLVGYHNIFRSTTLSIDKSIYSIFDRVYNNCSSVYLQLNIYKSNIPHILKMQDWGLIGSLFNLKSDIPKENIYSLIYYNKGQAGSFYLSELYLGFGIFSFVFSLIPLIFIHYFDLILDNLRKSKFILASVFLLYIFIYIVSISFASPFRVYSLFTILRFEYLFFIFIYLLSFKKYKLQ